MSSTKREIAINASVCGLKFLATAAASASSGARPGAIVRDRVAHRKRIAALSPSEMISTAAPLA